MFKWLTASGWRLKNIFFPIELAYKNVFVAAHLCPLCAHSYLSKKKPIDLKYAYISISIAEISHKLWFYELIAVCVDNNERQQQTRNEVRVDDGMKKRCPFYAPENLSQTTLSFSLLYMWNAKHFFLCFERLSDGWFWFITANYLTSFLSRSAEKKILCFYKTWQSLSHSHWLPFDVGVSVASCSLSIYICSNALLLYHQRYALFSLFDCWLFIRVHIFHLLWLNEDRIGKGSWRKAINIHMKCALKSSRKKTIKKILRN